jgi:cell division protein FtsQ
MLIMKLKRIVKYLFVPIFIGVLVFLFIFSNQRNTQKTINKIDIQFESEESYFLTHEIVNKLLIQNNERVQKQAKSVIDLYKLEEQVLESSYVEKVSLFITVDGNLNTVIKQREPIARILNGNSSYYIDSQAVKVPISENYSARVPVISGISNEKEVSSLIVLLNRIVDDNFLSKEIIGIELRAQNEYMFTVRSGNYRINFGDLNEIDSKIKKLKAFYSKVFLDSTIHKYKTINIKYHNQVVGEKITGYGK